MNNITDLETYDYHLPDELIAQQPLPKRDESRMLVYNKKTKTIEHKHFFDIINYLKKGDVLVMNNTRVLPARLLGTKKDTNAKIEILLLKRVSLDTWTALAKPLKRLKVGTIVFFNEELSCQILAKTDIDCTVKFIYIGVFETILERIGNMPLPHYIHETLSDKERYQTVYSKDSGSAAAPTAGLHFTQNLLDKILDIGVEIVYVTLDIGLGTFKPCTSKNILEHTMHTEHFHISKSTAKIINDAKKENRRVICVGTTSVRVVESVAGKFGGVLKEHTGDTDIFIYPTYKFLVTDALITNFHLPKSTLIMLVSAFTGIEETKKIYASAIENKYRFFSFGDSNFIY